MDILFIFIPIIMFIVISVIGKKQIKKKRNIIPLIVNELGFDAVSDQENIEKYFEGSYKGYIFSIQSYVFNDVDDSIKVNIEFSLPYSFYVKKENTGSNLQKIFGKNDFEIGDSSFDELIKLEGKHSDLLLVLNTQIRYLLLEIHFRSIDFTFTEKSLSIIYSGETKNNAKKIADIIMAAVELVNKLEKNKNITDLLSNNISEETLSNIKIKILNSINEKVFGNECNNEIIKQILLRDNDMFVRIYTAATMGKQGLGLILKMYKTLSSMRDRVFSINKVSEFNEQEAQDFLYKCLRSDEEAIKMAAVRAVKYYKNIEVIAELKKLAFEEKNSEELQNEARLTLKRLSTYATSEDKGWLSVSDKDESGALSLEEE